MAGFAWFSCAWAGEFGASREASDEFWASMHA